MTESEFAGLAAELNCVFPKGAFQKLERYFELLVAKNEVMNLTAITERNDVFIKHFLDSAMGDPMISEGASVCDVGTGAGFPGVVLKILRPDIRLTLMDSLNKRVVFLRELCGELGISAECVHIRAEDAGKSKQYRESFDVVVSRAVAKLNTLYEYTLPLVKVGGCFLAYKAHCEEELAASQTVPPMLGGKVKEVRRFLLPPAGDARTLILVQKDSSTPAQFPRGKNRERDCPLG